MCDFGCLILVNALCICDAILSRVTPDAQRKNDMEF